MSTSVTRDFAFRTLDDPGIYGVTVEDNRAIIRAREASDSKPVLFSVAWIFRVVGYYDVSLGLFMAVIYSSCAKAFGLLAGITAIVSIVCGQPTIADYSILAVSILIFAPDIISIGRYLRLVKRVDYGVFGSREQWYESKNESKDK